MDPRDLKHHLAAILAADAAGYSRLMAADERATVAALDAARAVFGRGSKQPGARGRHGRRLGAGGVRDRGRGGDRGAGRAGRARRIAGGRIPEDRRMRFRIGVHLGDVIEKADGTVYGDGVNIAARLQALAEPGGITVSDSVRGAVRGKVAASFEDRASRR